MSTPVSLEALNTMPAAQASEHLLDCCTSERWIHNVTSGRPYGTVSEILARSAVGPSRQEQAGVQAADRATLRALAEGNEAYERRFGHIYLVCATGRSAAELLALLRERLGHDPGTEWGIVRRELGKINRIRLQQLLEGMA